MSVTVPDGGQDPGVERREDSSANVMVGVFTGQYLSLVRLEAPGAESREDSSANVMVEVFTGQYLSLVRLAAMLLDDSHAAEDVVQDAYVRVAGRHYRLR